MDSLTQITLGAAVGEMVAGKKLGNRAMFWGAVGGTIPDLDVMASPFLSAIDELAFHRGISHSIVFSILGAICFGWIVKKLYESSYQKYFAALGWGLIPLGILYFLNRFIRVESIGFITAAVVLLVFGFLVNRRYFKNDRPPAEASLQSWQWLFFWTLFTHPILDCFTTYGTQLFQPFSDYRVAFNSISVVDPIYTVPFIITVIIASTYHRLNNKRRLWAGIGLGISSAYLLFTVANKQYINTVLQDTLDAQGIQYARCMTNPTIFNNILWNGIAETEDGYYLGQYSLWDAERSFDLNYIPRNEELLQGCGEDDKVLRILKWFSNDYYTAFQDEATGMVQYSDLRFGVFDENAEKQNFVFSFFLEKGVQGCFALKAEQAGPPDDQRKGLIKKLWKRIRGIK